MRYEKARVFMALLLAGSLGGAASAGTCEPWSQCSECGDVGGIDGGALPECKNNILYYPVGQAIQCIAMDTVCQTTVWYVGCGNGFTYETEGEPCI